MATRQPDTQPTGAAPAGRTLTIVAFVLAALAVIFFPIVLGPVAAICAGVAMSKGDPLAKWALTAAIACTIAGMVIGYAVLTSMQN
ncbi:MAG TPA: hypothetical protein VEU29_06745 [Actinomycetota bacterium]|nr:hypothetical protein [Actinomycetota bacterium]